MEKTAETDSANTREAAIRKLLELPPDEVSKVLIFMAGLEAGAALDEEAETASLR